MRISVKVKPGSKEDLVEKTGECEFQLRVKAQAKEGRANSAAIKLISEYFDIPKSMVIILKGHNSKNKIIRILEEAK